MEWLNYHHLLYFWVVAREGTIVRAGRVLGLAQPTISGQIRRLETVLGAKLFARRGRNLVLTETGRVAFGYAEEIFSLGQEFIDEVQGRTSKRALRVVVGVSGTLAKALVFRMLEPAFRLDEHVRIVCREDRSVDAFIGELASRAIDVVLADSPAGRGTSLQAYSHLLGECGTTFCAAPRLARRYRSRFPRSLDGAPMIVPQSGSTLRRALDEWLDSAGVRPRVAGEIDDATLAMAACEQGLAVFVCPEAAEAEVKKRYRVAVIGRTPALRHSFYAISLEKKLRHPAVVAICDAARERVLGRGAQSLWAIRRGDGRRR